MGCPFCTVPASRVIVRGGLAMVIRDEYPISLGHTLILPARHVASFFALSPDERAELLDLLHQASSLLKFDL